MSLFKNSDVAYFEGLKKSFSQILDIGATKFLTAGKKNSIKEAIGNLNDFESLFYYTDGAWSNIDLIEYLLSITGPARLFFHTWSIASDTIRRLQHFQEQGLITDTFAIIDQGIRNRKPEILQEAQAAFKNIKLIKCHAKTTVIQNDEFYITILGSANLTSNPRKEVGIILRNRKLAECNIENIMEEFANA